MQQAMPSKVDFDAIRPRTPNPQNLGGVACGLIGWRRSIEELPETAPPSVEMLQAIINTAPNGTPLHGTKRYSPGRDDAIVINTSNLLFLGTLLAALLPLCNISRTIGWPESGHRVGGVGWLFSGVLILAGWAGLWFTNKRGVLSGLNPTLAAKFNAIGISDHSLLEILSASFCCLCLLCLLDYQMGASPVCFTLIPQLYPISDASVVTGLVDFYQSKGNLIELKSSRLNMTEHKSEFHYYGWGCTWNQFQMIRNVSMEQCMAWINATNKGKRQGWNGLPCSFWNKLMSDQKGQLESCAASPPPLLKSVPILPSIGDAYFAPEGACIHGLIDGRFSSFYFMFIQGGLGFMVVMALLLSCHVWQVDVKHLMSALNKLERVGRLPRGKEMLNDYSREVSMGLSEVVGSTSGRLCSWRSWHMTGLRYLLVAVLWVLANQGESSFDVVMFLTSVLSSVLLNAWVSLMVKVLWMGVKVTYTSNYIRMKAIGELVDPKGPHKHLDVDKLRTWAELRNVLQTSVNIIDYQLSEYGFGAFLVCDVGLVVVLLSGVLLTKNAVTYILSTAAMMQLGLVVIISVYLLRVFSTAVKTTQMQRSQIKLLKDQRLFLLYKTMQESGELTTTASIVDNGPAMTKEQIQQLTSLIDLVIERLEGWTCFALQSCLYAPLFSLFM
eukprot:SAG31_NODE_2105_length_6432_cov_22.218696_1_plen_668_part_00